MKFQANDHQALKEIADEIILFEGIQHQNLVKYYGVEVHKVSPNAKYYLFSKMGNENFYLLQIAKLKFFSTKIECAMLKFKKKRLQEG